MVKAPKTGDFRVYKREAPNLWFCESESAASCVLLGVAMDDLVYICTKIIARHMDTQGLDRVFDAAEEARPLLARVVVLVDEVGFSLARLIRLLFCLRACMCE